MQLHDIIRSCQEFPPVIPVLQVSPLRVTHPSAMVAMVQAPLPHRLACVKHSVSVHPEPGSNSSFNYFSSPYFILIIFDASFRLISFLPLICLPLSSPTTPAVDKNYSIKYYTPLSIPFFLYFFEIFFSFYFQLLFQHSKNPKNALFMRFKYIHR